ncbi:hypothetical protein BH11GEM2_BH11GEM2_34990 [soil metagenome]
MITQLIGKWKTDPDDPSAQANYGQVTQTFHEDGRLIYIIHSPQKDQVMRLVYRVDGDVLITDQPSAPSEHRTTFSFDNRGRLILEDEGERSRFIRVT